MADWAEIVAALNGHGLALSEVAPPLSVVGGDISAAWRAESESGPVFVKTGPASSSAMFDAEAEGLAVLAAANAIRVPRVLANGTVGATTYMALEWLAFGNAQESTEQQLGTQLAQLHRKCAKRFGWHRDNTIGATPQHNPWTDDWVDFYETHRLGFQLQLAASNGYTGELQALGETLIGELPELLADHRPVPSLLHGDLWGGNWATCDGEPVIFDPAVYYGDREADLAMTRLFGGFGPAFYEAYEAAWPLPPGHRQRDALYRLYHVINHLNLFGGHYLAQACSIMRRLI